MEVSTIAVNCKIDITFKLKDLKQDSFYVDEKILRVRGPKWDLVHPNWYIWKKKKEEKNTFGSQFTVFILVGKVYIIKVFQTGILTIPGIIKEDLSDARKPIEELCGLLSHVFDKPVNMVGDFTVNLMNFKTHMGKQININNLCHVMKEVVDGVKISFEALVSQLIAGKSQMDESDMAIISEYPGNKSITITKQKLNEIIASSRIPKIIAAIKSLGYPERYTTFLSRKFVERDIEVLRDSLRAYSMISSWQYSPDKYSALQVSLYSENGKTIKVIIFQSGKINIYGGSNRAQCEHAISALDGALKDPRIYQKSDISSENGMTKKFPVHEKSPYYDWIKWYESKET